MLLLCVTYSARGQFTKQDSLRGSLTKERTWWDLTHYHLQMSVFPREKSLAGQNVMSFKVLEADSVLQIDLQPPMRLLSATYDGQDLDIIHEGNAHFIHFPLRLKPDSIHTVTFDFEGKPPISRRPPWDGGLTWTRDANGRDFIASTCQGEGASLWWPCKDHPADEPDSVLLSIRVPDPLMDVSNGRLRKTEHHEDGTSTYHWFVDNPINHYGININIGEYESFSEVYIGENGGLDCHYYVLPYNLNKAKKQFTQVPKMLEAFEYWFGPYPFYEDGFKLVEVPYLGMEHQSSVTYGNRYLNGYLGQDLSQTGFGLLFDFIIIHEAGHEWFANNITAADNADMWIHEGFTAYSECLYLDYHFGKDTAAAYVIGTRSKIKNDRPIQGTYGVNRSGSGDMYYKGANMLHTLRTIINDDAHWRNILRGLNRHFRHQTVSYAQITDYINKHTTHDLTTFFDQYVRDTRVPILEYRLYPGGVEYRWTNCVEDFDMPVDVIIDGKKHRIHPDSYWHRQSIDKPSTFEIDRNYYVAGLRIL